MLGNALAESRSIQTIANYPGRTMTSVDGREKNVGVTEEDLEFFKRQRLK